MVTLKSVLGSCSEEKTEMQAFLDRSVEPPIRAPLLLTLQVNAHSQPEKKGVSTPTRQTPTTPTSVPKSISMQQHGAKAKVALLAPSLYYPQINLQPVSALTTSDNHDNLIVQLIRVYCQTIILSSNNPLKPEIVILL